MTDETSFIWQGYDAKRNERTLLVVNTLTELHTHEQFDDFLISATNLISKEFGLAFIGLYLVDESQQQAVFRAGSGIAGGLFLKRNYKVSLSWDIRAPDGLVIESINKNAICVTGSTLIDGFFYSLLTFNPETESVLPFQFKEVYGLSAPQLPNTRLEMILPLRTQEKVIGALEIEHSERYLDIRTTSKQILPIVDKIALICESHLKANK